MPHRDTPPPGLFAAIAESSSDLIWAADGEGRLTYASARALREMLALDVAQVLGRPLADLVAPGRAQDAEALRAALAGGKSFQLELRLASREGTAVRVALCGTPLVGPDGRPVGGVGGVVTDLSERDRREADIRRQRAFLRQVIDINPHFIFAKDRAGRFTLVNQAIADCYGVRAPDDLLGKTDADFNPNRQEVEFFRRKDLEVMDTGRELRIPEEVITDAQGHRRYLETVKRPLVGEDGRADQLLGVATDITERKRAESELRRAEERLRQAEKMEAVGRLAGGIAHDFNNLLVVVLGCSELLLRRLPREDKLRPVAEQILAAGRRASQLTKQLLTFSRQQVLELKVVDLNAIITDTERMLRRVIGADVDLSVRLAPGPALVKADAGQLVQVILN
ncbi:MAG TPA: PAS domain-containing protein, partial [Planctomycetota bacterium]|nr:PAS domain-containing protein [Planctomycetota bacterium]